MNFSRAEQLTANFYDWEQLGRGWRICDYPVQLEPPFHPFFFHEVLPNNQIDDGRRLHVVEKLFNLFRSVEKNAPKEPIVLKPSRQRDNQPLVAILISLPHGLKIGMQEMEQLLLMLSYTTFQLSFELIADSKKIRLQFVTRECDLALFMSQIKSYFPLCVLTISHEPEAIIDQELEGTVFDFGLDEEFMRPIHIPKSLDLDPFTGLFGIMEHLNGGERLALQILFCGTVNPWSESILRSVMDNGGDAFFLDAPEMLPLAKEKVSSPLFGVTVRMLAQAETLSDAFRIGNAGANAVVRLSSSNANRLTPLNVEDYPIQKLASDITARKSHRLGMILNSKELASLVHLPSSSIFSTKLFRESKKTKEAPQTTEGHKFVLGSNFHQGREKEVSIAQGQRFKHLHVIGATGTGKSTLLQNLICQDIIQGKGIAVLDPHGDLIESILQYIPEERIADVILIDPADNEYPVGLNILQAHSEIEKEVLSSDLVAAFRRLSTSWGDQMNSVFANAILAFLESSAGGTLMDLRRFLIEKSFRDSFLQTVADHQVIYYWQKEFPLLKSTSIGPILTRLDTFLRPKLIRNMVAQKKSIDFESILDGGRILLVKLSQGLIGNENSFLLGTFIVSKIHQAAMARQAKSKEARNEFFVYVDEFQNFITPSMSAILSGARKYHLGLILAHQDMQQLIKYDSELASSVVANAGTRICFRLGDTDAKKFENGFSFFDSKDLQSLNVGEALARIERPDFDFNLSITLYEGEKSNLSHSVVDYSRANYGTPLREIESISLEVAQPIDILKTESESRVKKETPIFNKPEHRTQLTKEKSQETINNLSEKNSIKVHRYLQSLIKKMAEARGYKATIEELTPDGNGRVDVSLERNKFRIACEITVTTTDLWEVHNIQKCLTAGYEVVIVCSTEKGNLEKIKKKCDTLLPLPDQEKVRYYEPTELFLYLDEQIAKEASTEIRTKGYRVKVNYTPVSEKEAEQKKDRILKSVTESLKSKK